MAEPSSLTRARLVTIIFLYIFGRLGDKEIFVAAVTWHRARERSRATKTTVVLKHLQIKYIYKDSRSHGFQLPTKEVLQSSRRAFSLVTSLITKQHSFAAANGQLWARFKALSSESRIPLDDDWR